MSDLGHVLFGGVEGTLTSFATVGNAIFDGVPPMETRKPGVIAAAGTVRISAPLGREIGYLEVGEFRQPLLPRRRVWRSSPTQLIFPQPVPCRYWQLDVDAPPAAHARLDAILSELCNFHSLSTVEQPELVGSEDDLYGGGENEISPSPLVLDAINAIKLRSVPVSQASREINDKKLPPQRILSNYLPFSSSRKSSGRAGSAPQGALADESAEQELLEIRPFTAPEGNLITPETSRDLDIVDGPGSPTKAVISRFDYFESVAGDLDSQPLTPLQHSPKLESLLDDDDFVLGDPIEMHEELQARAFILSPERQKPMKPGAFDPATPLDSPQRESPNSSLKTPESTLVSEHIFSPTTGPSTRHSISSSSTLDEILELFTPDFKDLDTKLPPLDGPTVSELTQRNLVQFAPPSTFPALDRRENVRFSHPLIPTPANAVSYRMRSPRPNLPQNVHHDVTTVSGFIGWHLMNRILPPRR